MSQGHTQRTMSQGDDLLQLDVLPYTTAVPRVVKVILHRQTRSESAGKITMNSGVYHIKHVLAFRRSFELKQVNDA